MLGWSFVFLVVSLATAFVGFVAGAPAATGPPGAGALECGVSHHQASAMTNAKTTSPVTAAFRSRMSRPPLWGRPFYDRIGARCA